jgi:hypothetical protein
MGKNTMKNPALEKSGFLFSIQNVGKPATPDHENKPHIPRLEQRINQEHIHGGTMNA